MTQPGKPRICMVVSSGFTVQAFLVGHITRLSQDYSIDLVVGECSRHLITGLPSSVPVLPLSFARAISPFSDALALLRLWKMLRAGQYAAVHSVTPKGGLLAMVAGFLARVPVRVHTFTGQVWATRRGIARLALRLIDGLIASLATTVLVDSPSQKAFLIEEGVLPEGQGIVLGDGSISGVDANRFHPDPLARLEIRAVLDIPYEAPVLLYAGRLTREKGLLDLARAFERIASVTGAYLMMVGPDEGSLRTHIVRLCGDSAARLRFINFTDRPQAYMAAADILCLPSYREGFGNVIIEAAACGAPAVASSIYGITDAVEDGSTGLLHPPGDVAQLAAALTWLITNSDIRHRMAKAGLERARALYSSERLTESLANLYRNVLAAQQEDASEAADTATLRR